MKESFQKWLASRKVEARAAYNALMRYYPFTLDDLPDEIWKFLPDYEDYQVSNYGRTKSFKCKKAKICKPQVHNAGYLHVALSKDNKVRFFQVHRLVALCFIPNPEGKPQVNHRDGHPLNNHVSNLEWVTANENIKHAYDIGLKKSGEGHGRAKLTVEQVQYIRENPENLTNTRLAEMIGVDHTTIGLVQRGKLWKEAGGVVRKANQWPLKISVEVRKQIRAEFIKGDKTYGARPLARKYGVSHKTIFNIIRES